jgi:GNAT superfamily N-acetyltransferase
VDLIKKNMVNFKMAVYSDISALNILINQSYRGESAKKGWTSEADLIQGLRTDPTALTELLDDPHGAILMMYQNNELRGCVHLLKSGEILKLGMLTVSPLHQGKGLGDLILKHSEDYAHQVGATLIEMCVISKRLEVISYYERRGYRFTGETRPFPSHDPRNGTPLYPLVFNVMTKRI